ncbi:flavin-dependent dehydrogenase [Gloeobacter morelensis]|uniref:Flavin-dependent dehydrogenase n=1 Tax=Gloeobacter morelensis MG652769 TaxID=2781736 RepID=A0ABY3PN79_9CYAN|nr:flavin-dependent dehydrogenase [Gloeobacter morelensis]UFP95024.1 flavin-dependent dehydrogenase [Gloeobacter morelensis MG652769]
MEQLLYLEVPAPTAKVREWLQVTFRPAFGTTSPTPDGFRLSFEDAEWVCFVWELQRTTYLKVFRWSGKPGSTEAAWLGDLKSLLEAAFPLAYPQLPAIDLSNQSIFEALRPHYPLTVHYFETRMENGEYALKKAYWWEKRWREGAAGRRAEPEPVIFQGRPAEVVPLTYDVIYCGAALGIIHAAAMARLGWRVAVIERGPFGGMNREWNISRSELESLVELGLFGREQVEGLILNEYYDGLNKFYDGNVPPRAKGKLLHTPTVLNVALDAEKLLHLCGEQVRAHGGAIFDCTEFDRIHVWEEGLVVEAHQLGTGERLRLGGRLCIDAMGSASPIALQLTGGRAFDSVCPTVGAVVRGFKPGVWDLKLGDVLCSHGDISRGRQLIWELFPGKGDEMAIYLFYYHQIHPDNPGSLLDLYEDFFAILPEYKRCDLGALELKKATFGYIPAGSALETQERRVAFDRLLTIGDAASLQSPLVFTGFGSLVRNLPRLCELLHTALQHDLLAAADLDCVRASQSNIAVTWLFSRAMMVPTGRRLSPERINAILNIYFDILADSPPGLVDAFLKDRLGWIEFTNLALRAAFKNPRILTWAVDVVGTETLVNWLPAYGRFAFDSLQSAVLGGWLPEVVRSARHRLEKTNPRLWYRLLAWSYRLTYGIGRPARTGFVLS